MGDPPWAPPPFALGRGPGVHVEAEPRRAACGVDTVARATKKPAGAICPLCAQFRAAAFERIITAEHRATATEAHVRLVPTVDGIAVSARGNLPAALAGTASAVTDALAARLIANWDDEVQREERQAAAALRPSRLCPHSHGFAACDVQGCPHDREAAVVFRPGEGPRRAD